MANQQSQLNSLQKSGTLKNKVPPLAQFGLRQRHRGGEIWKNGPHAGRYLGATHSEMRLL